MAKKLALLFAALAVLAFAGVAHAEISVEILAVSPTDGTIAEGETAKIGWRIEADGSGTYSVEVGGDGTEGSGDQIAASDGSGSFGGTTTGTSTISADNDLEDGDGDYTIYVIATSGTETDYATTTITLDSPPDQVTGVLARRGDQKIFVTWDEHEDPDIDYYLVYYATHSGVDASDYDGVQASEGASPVDADLVTELSLSGLTNETTYFVRVSAVDESGSESPLSAESSATPTDTVGYAEMQGDEGNCFIATAAYGSYDHRMVRNLRELRDRVLLQSAPGRLFVRAYYAASPPLAAWIAKHPVARASVRAALQPVAIASRCEVRFPGSVSLSMITLLGLAWLAVRRRRHEEAK
ncbi:MAG TPA: fibronectin type III domain-containing protein [bacterium]|nr:fibronectin type III domain-containing protein [bacterium]